MKRLSLGWGYAKQSLAIVRKDGALTALAAIGFALGLALAIGPLAAATWAFETETDVIGFAAAAVACFAFYIGLTFSGVAVASAAAEVISGEDAKVTTSLGAASRRLGPILGWSVVGTLVALVLALARGKGGRGANTLASAGNEAWSLVTFLAVPVIAFEGLSPMATLKRSASLFRERWGEQVSGTVSISLVFFLLSLVPLMLVIAGIVEAASYGPSVLGVTSAIVGLIALAAIGFLGRAASATFGAIVYRYATTGEVPATIARWDLENLARHQPGASVARPQDDRSQKGRKGV
jgi:Ca2+/Na+ antiporter